MNLFVMDSFSLNNHSLCRQCCWHITDSCTYMDYVKSMEEYPNKVARLGLNRAYIKIRKPNLPCTENSLVFGRFYGFLRFVVWTNSGHFWGVYQSHYCVSEGAFPFSFVYGIYLNIASYLHGKQIKKKLGNKLYVWMIFICVHVNLRYMRECPTMTLKWHFYCCLPCSALKSSFYFMFMWSRWLRPI